MMQQIDALIQSRLLKLEQARNKLIQANLKVQSDSIDLSAAQLNFKIAKDQLLRMEELFKDGLKSLTDLGGAKAEIARDSGQSNFTRE
jgi:adhesin transport system membrane fusion protein